MFHDREDAGRKLAARLTRFRALDPLVLGLPRGGVPVAYEVARALDAPLDVVVARKIGAPGHEEYGIGAVAQGGAFYLDEPRIAALGVHHTWLARAAAEQSAEIERRLRAYRGDRPTLDARDRVVILVDDGLATGVTTRAAVRALRKMGPREVVLAVPAAARDTARALRAEVDELICLEAPEDFYAVGQCYEDFGQTTDDEVIALLARAERERAGAVSPRGSVADGHAAQRR